MEAITPDILMEQGRALHKLALSVATRDHLVETPEGQQLWEDGILKGIEKGKQEAMVETVARILAIRFIIEMDHFEKELKQLPLNVLKELTEPALNLTQDEFEALLRQKLRRLGLE